MSLIPLLTHAADRFHVTLRLPPEGLYAREEMQIEFRIEDTTRPDPVTGFAPVVRAVPEAVIDMPEMPAMPKFTETAHPEGAPGDYGIHPTFAHGGDYRLHLEIHPPNAEPFTVDYPLHVLDAAPTKRKPAPSRYTLELIAHPKKPRAGEPAELLLIVHDRDNANAAVATFETVHESLLHLVIVRRDLSHFSHEHPQFESGAFHLTYTFPAGGDYRLFADLVPKGAGSQILDATLSVAGPEGERFDISAITPRTATPWVPARKTVPLPFPVPADVEPYLGALGHLMIVSADASDFIHSHPVEDLDSPRTGTLHFLARFPKPGFYRAWLQFRRNGSVETKDFIFEARPSQ